MSPDIVKCSWVGWGHKSPPAENHYSDGNGTDSGATRTWGQIPGVLLMVVEGRAQVLDIMESCMASHFSVPQFPYCKMRVTMGSTLECKM
jgi:hypothetical protein